MLRSLSFKEKKAFKEILSLVWRSRNQCLPASKFTIKCVAICCTESSCYATNGKETLKANNFGPIIGDPGSASELALKFIRLSFKSNSRFLENILGFLSLHSAEELIDWSLNADKEQISSIAYFVVSEHFDEKKVVKIVERSVSKFIKGCIVLITKLWMQVKSKEYIDGHSISIACMGSLFEINNFKNLFMTEMNKLICQVDYCFIKQNESDSLKKVFPDNSSVKSEFKKVNEDDILPKSTKLSVTEMRNQSSTNLDKMSVDAIIDLMLQEESGIHKKIFEKKAQLIALINKVTKTLKNGGRIIYTGAGTSGRICVLDASECQQTFNVPPNVFQGVIAGGMNAMYRPLETAEDSINEGIEAIEVRGVNRHDVVIGVSASGKTPFVWGSLYEAQKRNAFTCLLSFNPNLEFRITPDMVIMIDLGPEILTGSTRLKCGSATKNILNMISTISMVRYGKCIGNLMSDLLPLNEKLKKRALRIVLSVCNQEKNLITSEEAKKMLEDNDFNIKLTISHILNQ